MTSKINEKQLVDKIERFIGRKQHYNAGLSLMLESQYNFFMFTPSELQVMRFQGFRSTRHSYRGILT